MKRFKVNRKTYDPPIWSDLLLRIDAMTLTGILQIEQAACLRKLVWARDAQTADVFVNLADRADGELAAGLLSMTNASRRYKHLETISCGSPKPESLISCPRVYFEQMNSCDIKYVGHITFPY